MRVLDRLVGGLETSAQLAEMTMYIVSLTSSEIDESRIRGFADLFLGYEIDVKRGARPNFEVLFEEH